MKTNQHNTTMYQHVPTEAITQPASTLAERAPWPCHVYRARSYLCVRRMARQWFCSTMHSVGPSASFSHATKWSGLLLNRCIMPAREFCRRVRSTRSGIGRVRPSANQNMVGQAWMNVHMIAQEHGRGIHSAKGSPWPAPQMPGQLCIWTRLSCGSLPTC